MGPDGVTVGAYRVDGDTEVVDAVKAAIGGNATVFSGTRRVATSVTKPDGGRGVGTELAPGPARDAVVRDGAAYRGEAEILGSPYMTLYEPLRDAGGAQVGILYVGLPKSAFLAFLDHLYVEIALATLVATLLGAAAMRMVARRAVRPLDGLTATMGRLRDGDLSADVPMTGRSDVLGSMARSVEAFRDEVADVAKLSQAREDAEAGYIAAYKAGKSVVEVSNLEAVLKAKGLVVDI